MRQYQRFQNPMFSAARDNEASKFRTANFRGARCRSFDMLTVIIRAVLYSIQSQMRSVNTPISMSTPTRSTMGTDIRQQQSRITIKICIKPQTEVNCAERSP